MFKAGDYVTIRHHTQEEKDNYEDNWDSDGAYWADHMNEMEGKTYQIDKVLPNGYRIVDDYGGWRFAQTSFVPPYDQF